MPHFIVDCPEELLDTHSKEEIIKEVHKTANTSKLFDQNDIKIRVRTCKVYSVGNKREPYIHVFSYIMQGRTAEQKALLSKSVVEKLVLLFPDVPNIAMNVSEFEKATYYNRTML
ncbi:MAG: 5-carboxymethyl-2-hydroxymuconate isomerase [Balneolaceae bacterium]|nr:5-carboxymethyl-2-hydroxymuconate isomerase [Balneolaceae bacterium]